MKKFYGVFTALVSPFKNGKVDFDSLQSLLAQQLKGGVNGFVVNGTTAESPTLDAEEREEIFRFVRKNCDLPLIMGTGTNCTKTTVAQTLRAHELGADAALVVTPYYNRPPQAGLKAHFESIADQAEIPIILYNVPSRTAVGFELETLVDLSKHENIVGVKEASGNLEFLRALLNECDSRFFVTSGDDASFLGLVKAGGKGVISVLSHLLPAECLRWCNKVASGELDVMSEFEKYSPLVEALSMTTNPIPVKAALAAMGVIDSAEMRLPLLGLSRRQQEQLLHVIDTLKLDQKP